MKINLAITLNTQRPDKAGKYPVRLRSTIDSKVTYYPTGIMLLKEQLVNGVVVNHPNKDLLNTTLLLKKGAIEKELLQNSIIGEVAVKAKKNHHLKFSDYAQKKIKEWSATQGIETTIKHKIGYLKRVNEYNPGIRLQEFDKEVLTGFEVFCRKRGNNENTVWSATKFVKTVINAAIADGIIVGNPLMGFKGAKYTDPFRETLSAEELELLEKFAENKLNPKKLLNTANWFLFSCYCGLRYGDLAGFVGFKNGKVLLKTEKTGEVVSIYATEKIIETKNRLTQEIFSNQKSNDYIKVVMAAIGVTKKISFHNARHTFAVEFLNRGGRLEILSKILGHSDIKTTSIYARISNNLADEEMKKVWDQKPPTISGKGKTKNKPTKD